MVAPTHALSEADAVQTVFDNLEKEAQYRSILQMSNPDTDNLLKDRVEFTLLRKEADGEYREPPRTEGGETLYDQGDIIGFRIKNKTNIPLYFTVLDLGIDEEESTPQLRKSDLERCIARRRELHCHVRGGARQPWLARELPIRKPAGRGRVLGYEVCKLVATSTPVDLSFLEQAGFQGSGYPCREIAVYSFGKGYEK